MFPLFRKTNVTSQVRRARTVIFSFDRGILNEPSMKRVELCLGFRLEKGNEKLSRSQLILKIDQW